MIVLLVLIVQARVHRQLHSLALVTTGMVMGSKCRAVCDVGRSPYGQAVCHRNGHFKVIGLEHVGDDQLLDHIGCEFQCTR